MDLPHYSQKEEDLIDNWQVQIPQKLHGFPQDQITNRLKVTLKYFKHFINRAWEWMNQQVKPQARHYQGPRIDKRLS
jgi:hypothetical protein